MTTSKLYIPKPDSDYFASSELADAANVAQLLSRPLLLTGPPGSGKSSFATSLAEQLCPTDCREPLVFNTRSTSTAQELFYSYDAMRRFQDGQISEKSNRRDSALPFVTYGPLGLAILQGCDEANRDAVLYGSSRENEDQAFGVHVRRLMEKHPQYHAIQKRAGFRRVVLIDELDKAPRDFPNDILNVLDGYEFTIPELANEREIITLRCRPDCKPLIVFTSNSEKLLPDAFLRRCIFFEMETPTDNMLRQIVLKKLPSLSGLSGLVRASLDCFRAVGRQATRQGPSTAELLDWLSSMHQLAQAEGRERATLHDHGLRTLSALIKDSASLPLARQECLNYVSLHPTA